MANMSWVTSWSDWRNAMGPSGSRHRRDVETFLKTHPAILYWGDSWFSTPLYLNLARQSARRINGLNMIIGKPGATAAELFDEDGIKRMVERIQANPFDVVCLSAGGNDCLSDRLAKVFKAWLGKAPTRNDRIDALAAYQILSKSGLLDGVHRVYDRLLSRLQAVRKIRPSLRVLGQPYFPIKQIGVAADLTVGNIGLVALLKGDVGPWLWGPMQHVLRNKQEGETFARMMLEDGFRDGVLGRLAKQYKGFFSVVDYSTAKGIGNPGFWNDEIHPSETGFDSLAMPFNQALKTILPAAKQGAVAII